MFLAPRPMTGPQNLQYKTLHFENVHHNLGYFTNALVIHMRTTFSHNRESQEIINTTFNYAA